MLYRTISYVIIAFTTIFTVSCASDTDVNYDIVSNDSDINVSCKLYKIDIRDVPNKDKNTFNIKSNRLTYIYGKIKIKNISDKESKYNLGQYHLSLYGNTSSGVYIDSVASYIIRDEIIKPNETTIKSVYWVFDKAIPTKNYGNIKLVILPK